MHPAQRLLMHLHVAAKQANLTTTGIQNWAENNLVGLAIFVVGGGIFLLANKGDHKKAFHRVGVVMIGLFVIGLSLGGGWKPLAQQLVHLVNL